MLSGAQNPWGAEEPVVAEDVALHTLFN